MFKIYYEFLSPVKITDIHSANKKKTTPFFLAGKPSTKCIIKLKIYDFSVVQYYCIKLNDCMSKGRPVNIRQSVWWLVQSVPRVSVSFSLFLATFFFSST
jgi:hypothetical protein